MSETENFLQIIDSCVRVCGWRYVNRGNSQWVIIRGVRTTAVASTALSEGVGMWLMLEGRFYQNSSAAGRMHWCSVVTKSGEFWDFEINAWSQVCFLNENIKRLLTNFELPKASNRDFLFQIIF
ncbi:hypothetical protein TNCT_644261 [Trichonephila clavata]|uniref:Uncharacterized protein n=1 Tax=Trichonephila clavata TaxID=2740835 RepID=A0A8X6K6T5_TRICU|nr:hypothetical protein TNCT_644261 [Trichonephila clavata]